MAGRRFQVQLRAPKLVDCDDSAVYLQFFCEALEFALFPHLRDVLARQL